MIIDTFVFGGDHERVRLNVFIEPLDVDEKTVYVVGLTNPGEGIPSQEKLREIALSAETVSPFEGSLTLNELCKYIQDAVHSGTWAAPLLIPEQLLEISAPLNPYEEGLADAARGLHYNANPHVGGTKEADDWDEGWLKGRSGNLDELKH
jgi:hypothetical protein